MHVCACSVIIYYMIFCIWNHLQAMFIWLILETVFLSFFSFLFIYLFFIYLFIFKYVYI